MNVPIPSGLGLPQTAGTQVLAFVLVLGRVGPLFLLAPILSATLVARRAKVIVAFGLALALTPMADAGRTIPTDPIAYGLAFAREVGIGSPSRSPLARCSLLSTPARPCSTPWSASPSEPSSTR